jgi:hypothetical protein
VFFMSPFISYASAGHGVPQKCRMAQRRHGSMSSTLRPVTKWDGSDSSTAGISSVNRFPPRKRSFADKRTARDHIAVGSQCKEATAAARRDVAHPPAGCVLIAGLQTARRCKGTAKHVHQAHWDALFVKAIDQFAQVSQICPGDGADDASALITLFVAPWP